MRDAASVVVIRDSPRGPEVLLLRRPATGTFPGAWVFPGGAVDPEDRLLRPDDRLAVPGRGGPDEAVRRRAAVREAREEAGLWLPPSGLVHISRWLPPPQVPVRFDTWFFLTRLPDDGHVVVDGREIVDHRWLRPAEALDLHARDALHLVDPTWVTLHTLRDAPTADDAVRVAAGTAPTTFDTRVLDGPHGPEVLVWEGDAAWPAVAPGHASPGGRHRLRIDSRPWQYVRDHP